LLYRFTAISYKKPSQWISIGLEHCAEKGTHPPSSHPRLFRQQSCSRKYRTRSARSPTSRNRGRLLYADDL